LSTDVKATLQMNKGVPGGGALRRCQGPQLSIELETLRRGNVAGITGAKQASDLAINRTTNY
jgi:hypothetical protein